MEFFQVIITFCIVQKACMVVGTQNVEDFLGDLKNAERQSEKKFEHLSKENEHEYNTKVSESQAKFLFKFIDKDKNGLLDRKELILFGKLTISNDTESAEIWADMSLMEDKTGDKRLAFKEFYQPILQYGGTREKNKKDPRHQHKDGHMHKNDPIKEEL